MNHAGFVREPSASRICLETVELSKGQRGNVIQTWKELQERRETYELPIASRIVVRIEIKVRLQLHYTMNLRLWICASASLATGQCRLKHKVFSSTDLRGLDFSERKVDGLDIQKTLEVHPQPLAECWM